MTEKVIKIKTSKIKCPTCKKSAIEPYTPFCSKKCSNIDLMRWLSNENYIDYEEYKNSSH